MRQEVIDEGSDSEKACWSLFFQDLGRYFIQVMLPVEGFERSSTDAALDHKDINELVRISTGLK